MIGRRMHRNVMTGKKYVEQICVFKDQYLNDYGFVYQKARDKIYCRTLFNREVLLHRLRELQNTIPNSEVLQFTRHEMQSDNQITQFSALQKFCKKNRKWNLYSVAIDIAEYEALLLVWDFINKPNTNNENEGKEMLSDPPKPDIAKVNGPYFKEGSIQVIIEILNDYFNPDQRDELQIVIETWGAAKSPLTFNGNGNKLADAFRKLLECEYIINCPKKDLEIWIIRNFQFINPQKEIKRFTEPYIQKCISRNDYPCKYPILRIEDGSIIRNT